ncbi:hypothetical protein SUGI_0799560 [Cryptomeria japonica]|nr:hypothetical protein SUGI_0799560 [Cryptomeria japonica]
MICYTENWRRICLKIPIEILDSEKNGMAIFLKSGFAVLELLNLPLFSVGRTQSSEGTFSIVAIIRVSV